MSNFTDYRSHIGTADTKFYKTTLYQSRRLMLGLNCMEPGQSHALHNHSDQDKFYLVMEGSGEFTVGDETRVAGPGDIVWAPAGVDHGVSNQGTARLVLLMGMAPAP